jgi:hypothetical protein
MDKKMLLFMYETFAVQKPKARDAYEPAKHKRY